MTRQTSGGARFDEFKVKGNQLLAKVREIIDEGNARRVTIKKDGRVLLEFPLTVGVGGAAAALVLAPTLAAVGAVAALVTDVDVIIEREPAPPAPPEHG
ncbi:MAG: DUF4342 domain-containing protein [Rhodothermales bacterium]|nr:DUF4342 domain-containing protein [Rhodothermales bacterium]